MLKKAGSVLNRHVTINPLTGTVKTIQCGTAVCELGFSVMDIIVTKIRTELFISSISATMFVKFDITPLSMCKATPYAESWLVHNYSTANP
jgi:hypothetical protein